MNIFFWGAGYLAEDIFSQLMKFPSNIKIIGISDNDSGKWEKKFYGIPVYSPKKMCEMDFDKVIILSDVYFEAIKDQLIYWYKIDADKIEDRFYLLKILYIEKYKDSQDTEIQKIIKYLSENEISSYNQYLELGKEVHIVQWDYIENMPYILFEDKKMYFPYDYKFPVVEGKKVVIDILAEQQELSPHLYIKDDISVDQGDVIVDAGVQEGNFALRCIEKVSKAYLFECDKHWIKPLEKTFEKFRDKVVLYNKFLGQYNDGVSIKLDSVIEGDLNFLKMDIEGAEVNALLGGRNILLGNDVKCAVCSYHRSGDETAIKAILQSYGYKTTNSKGYMIFLSDRNIYSSLDFRRGIVYAKR